MYHGAVCFLCSNEWKSSGADRRRHFKPATREVSNLGQIINFEQRYDSTLFEAHRVSKKTVHFCFCQNIVKFPPILISFGR